MDNKQKKQLLSAVYKTLILFNFLCIGWVGYFSVDLFFKKTGILWLNITLLAVAFLVLCFLCATISKVRKIKNLYSVANYLFLIIVLTFIASVAGIFYGYYTGSILEIGYYLTITVLFLSELFSFIIFIVALKLSKIFKNTTITVDPISEIPNYDDELMLKKQLDELNRKREMKKVVDEIESIKKELGEE